MCSYTFDAKTEELLMTSEGYYSLGSDLNGDLRGALELAISEIPSRLK